MRGRGKLYFTEECQLLFVERMPELENHHTVNTKVMIDSSKNYQWMSKPVGKRPLGNRISRLKLTPHRLELKGKISTFTEKSGGHHLNQNSKIV